MVERKIEEPSWERSRSSRRRRGVGKGCLGGMGRVVGVGVGEGWEVESGGEGMAGDIVGFGCWK